MNPDLEVRIYKGDETLSLFASGEVSTKPGGGRSELHNDRDEDKDSMTGGEDHHGGDGDRAPEGIDKCKMYETSPTSRVIPPTPEKNQQNTTLTCNYTHETLKSCQKILRHNDSPNHARCQK